MEQWRNFLRLRDGTLDFGKLTMHRVDLIMIDVERRMVRSRSASTTSSSS